MEDEKSDEPTDEREGLTVAERKRLRAIGDTAGVLSGVYPPGYLEQLRADWPD